MAADAPFNPFRFSASCLLLAVTLLAVAFGGCIAFIRYANGQDIVATFDCGRGREIVISVARSWEVSQPIYYSVRENGSIVVPTTHFGDNYPPDVPHFTLNAANNGELVGVAYAAAPTHYLFIHDFSDGKSYETGDRPDLQASLDEARSGSSMGG